jgi:activator of HSP90 ATPase
METIKLSETFPSTAKVLFEAWMNSKEHSAFTGHKAAIEPREGGKFSAWDGYISGVTRSLQPYSRIVQVWRSTDFPDGVPDSMLEIIFEKVSDGTKIILIHSNLPMGQSKEFEKGWLEYYFKPMKKYFVKNK